jgi:hypothetical protein
MDLILPILLGLTILASFFIAYMSSKTWPIYQTVLVVFVFLACVGFFYLGARTLATHKSWGELVRRLEQETQSAEQQTVELRGGEQNAQGQAVSGAIPKLKQELEVLVSTRGGMLADVAVDSVEDSVAQLTLKSPDHGLVADSVLFVFDQKPLTEGGRYLGEFKVVKAEEGSPAVQIAPNLPLTDAQSKRLAASKGPWTLYTSMPIDDAGLFADLDEPTRQALLPKESLAEYANRERKLRDYELFFHENFVQRSLLADAISKLTSNIQRIGAAAQETLREVGYRETERGNLQADLKRFQFEVRTIAAYQKKLEDMLARLQQSLKAVFVDNHRMAALLTVEQLKAVDEINERTAVPTAVNR